ncbi:MAG: hypothetical protein KKH52_04795 [Nanoarchaeota archaeon]|nr:hypothetical protein [Nanoarchaeota archaeon]MBU1974684.1 hypothetical protein [Nanoarchaeota archaeon]
MKPSCKKSIVKACKKNPVLGKILEKKMTEISLFPGHYKNLRHDLKSEKRVHILKSFVLILRELNFRKN